MIHFRAFFLPAAIFLEDHIAMQLLLYVNSTHYVLIIALPTVVDVQGVPRLLVVLFYVIVMFDLQIELSNLS